MPASSADVAATSTGTLSVKFTGLRSAKGMIRACLTRNPALYLKCDRDPAALKANVVAKEGAVMEFAGVPPGDYGLAVIHDANSNNKVDTLLGIPREGVGFSRNPGMSFGPPKWDSVKFHVAPGPASLDIKLKYLL